MRTQSLRVSIAAWLALVVCTSSAAAQALVDQYGGVVSGVAPATGYFQVKQVGDRWLFVTPEGNGLWMTGIYAVIYSDSVDDLGTTGESRIMAKYGGGADWKYRWRMHAARRLKAWGFNTLAEYHHWAMRPGFTEPNPEKLPYIHIIKPSYYALDNRYSFGTGPVKNLIAGTDSRYYDGYRGAESLDVFDPNFESYVDGWMRGDEGLKYGNIGNPWMMGIAVDDTDHLFGFGPGAEVPAARLHPHLGWIALVTNFQQASSPLVTSYADRKVYTKYALRDFLASRYGTVGALNVAWGSTYTTFDSFGGWGVGTGLLDENGRNPWVGQWGDEMATASAGVRADVSEFLYQHARQYFTVVAAKVRQYAPRHLVFGPASFNFWGGLTRKEILRAAGESLDVLQCAIASQQVLELTASYAGNKPLVSWDAFVSNPDSALWRYANPADLPGGGGLVSQQAPRGQLYADNVDRLFNAVTSTGIHPVAGSKLWSWTDNWPEKANFGVVSFSDNAYDGKEAIRAPGSDGSGFPTGGEENDYGDFLTAVSAAHAEVRRSLIGGVRISNASMNVDGPTDGAFVPRTLGVSGWALDAGAAAGPGVDLVRIFSGASCSGTVLADATLGLSRPDVQAAFGLPASFGTSGFSATVTLPGAGAQQITACARSTITGAFAAASTRSLTVSGAQMKVDSPPNGGGVTHAVRVSGWAFDATAATGPGVNLVRVFQGAACSGTVLADATLGISRPAVPSIFGLPASFGTTGFTANITLPAAGAQQITVCAVSTVTGGFVAASTRLVTVSDAQMNVDGPPNGGGVSHAFAVSGWAFDVSDAIGPGVDLVRIFQGAACSGTVLADATLGIPRPDVRSLFGLPASFGTAGFSANITLPAGAQQITVCAVSTVTGGFVAASTRSVTVSDAQMDVDSPASGAIVPRTLGVSGWAFDASDAIGPGVDLVRIFQGAACSGTVLADATLGIPRPDIQSAFGLPASFGTAGFTANITLPAAGAQEITVCAVSTVTGGFVVATTRSFTVSDAQ